MVWENYIIITSKQTNTYTNIKICNLLPPSSILHKLSLTLVGGRGANILSLLTFLSIIVLQYLGK